jgi:hypothetical protein
MWYTQTAYVSRHLEGRDHLEDLDVYGSIILKWFLKKSGEI